MSASEDVDSDLIPNVLSQDTGQSSYACSHCRRQKVKCDRLLPQCGNCTRGNRICSYPLTVQKPGPKAGTHRRPRPQAVDVVASVATFSQHTHKRSRTDIGTEGGYQHEQHSYLDTEELASPNEGRDSISTTSKSPSVSHQSRSANPLFRIVHPSHEPLTKGDEPQRRPNSDSWATQKLFPQACQDLGVTTDQGRALIMLYFENFTAFSLFHRPRFEEKLVAITLLEQLKAFLAAIFAFSLRFIESTPHASAINIPRSAMLDFACRLQLECLEECRDDDPPLHLLQSLLLTTFQKLINGVRGKAWRMLGECIRIAYELKLHSIDAKTDRDGSNATTADSEQWIYDEERRRLWWAIWELDIFASTIRRLPGGIDWYMNKTVLPQSNEKWFKGEESPSCFLSIDPSRRWRDLVSSGNKSPSAWFILVNSFMWDAHKMGIHPQIWGIKLGYKILAADEDDTSENQRVLHRMRDLLDNCLHCAKMNLPAELDSDGRFLSFRSSPTEISEGDSTRYMDAARYSIHIMFQLTRFQLYSREIYHDTTVSKRIEKDEYQNDATRSSATHAVVLENAASKQLWARYADASNLVADVIRNSAPAHYQYVNPYLANTIWFAAAAQVVARLFGPDSIDRRLAASNFDLLTTTMSKYESFWEIPGVLKQKLGSLEEQLKQMRMTAPPLPENGIEATKLSVNSQPPVREGDLESTAGSTNAALVTNNTPTIDLGTSAQGFNFETPSVFTPGQFDFQQQNFMDTFFDDSTTWSNGGLNFNELFMYPYQ